MRGGRGEEKLAWERKKEKKFNRGTKERKSMQAGREGKEKLLWRRRGGGKASSGERGWI
jgi:hypothetical protein